MDWGKDVGRGRKLGFVGQRLRPRPQYTTVTQNIKMKVSSLAYANCMQMKKM